MCPDSVDPDDFLNGDSPETTTITDSVSLGFPGKRADQCYLVMIYGEFLGRRFEVTDSPILIGRAAECSIQLIDDSVSRAHCRIVKGEKGVTIQDLESTNGTYVNDADVASRIVNDGDRIKVGRSIFKFLSGDNIEHAYHEEIYKLKTVDGLTGAYNKRHFDEELEREVFRFFRYKRSLSMLLIDIDHFKKINDTYGHLAGDSVLAQLGSVISSNIGREETFCRYGGEEFALLMPEVGIKDAVQKAERLRQLIQDTIFSFDEMEIPVTVSIGVAEPGPSVDVPEDLVQAADERLYEAKRSGRNLVAPSPETSEKEDTVDEPGDSQEDPT